MKVQQCVSEKRTWWRGDGNDHVTWWWRRLLHGMLLTTKLGLHAVQTGQSKEPVAYMRQLQMFQSQLIRCSIAVAAASDESAAECINLWSRYNTML